MTQSNLFSCPSCGVRNIQGAKTCALCGTKFDDNPLDGKSGAISSKIWILVVGAIVLVILCLLLIVSVVILIKMIDLDIVDPSATHTTSLATTFVLAFGSTLQDNPILQIVSYNPLNSIIDIHYQDCYN